MDLIDTHAHLDMLKKLTPDQAVKEATEAGIRYIINIGSSIEASRQAKALSQRFDRVFSAAGLHPHYASGYGKDEEDTLRSIIEGSSKIVAVGETGFDFFRNKVSPADQQKAFESQIGLALEYKLPVVIHDRDAHQETLKVVSRYSRQKDFKAVVHCFSGDKDFADQLIDLGLYISFTGVLTFPNAQEVVKAARAIPIERIFLETDTPFLAPQAKRGQENQPAYVRFIAEKLAEIKGMSPEEISSITSGNAIDFFGLDGKR